MPHTHTPRQRLERQTKAAPAPPSRVSGPQAPKAAPCSSPPVGPLSGAPSPRCCCVSLPPVGQEQPQLRSQRPCPDGTRAVTAGAASGPCSVRPLALGSRGPHPHACSSSQRGFVCDTWGTESAADRLLRGEVLPTAPGLTAAADAPPPQTACGEPARAAGSGKHGTHGGTLCTFLSWEESSNSLASLVAELPEDKSSDYKTDLGQTAKMPGERRNQPLRGRSQAEGRPLAADSDPALGGFLSTGHHPPLETGRPLSGSLSSRQCSDRQPGQHRPGPPLHAQPVPTSSAAQHLSHQKDGVAGWLWGPCPGSTKFPGRRLSPVGSRGLQAGSGAHVCTVPCCDLVNNVWIKT